LYRLLGLAVCEILRDQYLRSMRLLECDVDYCYLPKILTIDIVEIYQQSLDHQFHR